MLRPDVDPRNAAAIHLLEHLGFKREGYLRERWIVPGETQDSLFYGLLKKEWNDTGIKYQILKRDQLLECLGAGPKAS